MNRLITKFYNSDDVNAATAELRQAKTRPISLSMIDNLLYEIKVPGGDNFKRHISKLDVLLWVSVKCRGQSPSGESWE